METQQNSTPEQEVKKQNLKDFSNKELMSIFVDQIRSYKHTSEFLEEYYNIKVTRQAVYARLKDYLVDKEDEVRTIKELAKKTISDMLTNESDPKLRLAAVKLAMTQFTGQVR